MTLFQIIDTAAPARPPTTPMSPRPSLMLAVTAPPGPPASAAEFLARLDPGLAGGRLRRPTRRAWPPSTPPRAPARHRAALPDPAGTAGPGPDGPGQLTDADVWYFMLEGTREHTVAEAQALAMTELVAHAATSRDAERRAILLACDDYSAVSGRVPLWQLYERGRSLGVGVQVSAQSWQGLGATRTSGPASRPPLMAGSG